MQIKGKTIYRLLICNLKTVLSSVATTRRHFAELSGVYYGSKSHWDRILTRDTRVGKKNQ